MKIYLLLLLFSVSAFARSAPDWVEDYKHEDQDYKYYLGTSLPKPTENDALLEATLNAQEQAISENFGMTTSLSNQLYMDEKSYTTTKRMTLNGPQVRLQDFERLNQDIQKGDHDTFQARVLYRYKKSSIMDERARLRTLPVAQMEDSNTESKSRTNRILGRLAIDSVPSDAEVYIDNVRWGTTPLKLTNKILYGVHEIRIEDDQFETKTETLILSPGYDHDLHYALKAAKGEIEITSIPSGAKVSINNRFEGYTPLKLDSLPVRKPLSVQLELKDHWKNTQEITLTKAVKKFLSVPLVSMKPEAEKEPEETPYVYPYKYSNSTPINITTYLGIFSKLTTGQNSSEYGGSFISYGAFLEFHFGATLGARVSYAYSSNMGSTSYGKYIGSALGFAVPIVFKRKSDHWFYFIPEAGSLSTDSPKSPNP